MELKPHEQQWYKDTCRVLSRYTVQKKRMEILELKLQRQCMPSVKMVANYSGGVKGNDSDVSDEVTLNDLQINCKSIELSLESLTSTEKRIIELRYFYEYRDVDVMAEIYVNGKATYYDKKDGAVRKVAKCLGILGLD